MLAKSQAGFSIFELMFFLLIVSGAWIGGDFGYLRLRHPGMVAGAMCGGLFGYLTSVSTTFLLAAIFKAFFGGPLFPPRKPDLEREND
ncbi:hypothetical protein [Chitinimonas sp.]|uniref:hypothetical protein n=1 Tax=Chitinimonas sp. TaxID=1934313 RepID=UPI0035B14C3D